MQELSMQGKKFDIEFPSLAIIYGIFTVMAGLTLPIVLIPLVRLTGYSEIVEEIAKVLVISFFILNVPGRKAQIFMGMFFGFLFGLSENFLYLNQILQLGDLSIFWQRFLWTVPMHIVAVSVMVLFGLMGRWFLFLGLIGAVILHLLFNGAIV